MNRSDDVALLTLLTHRSASEVTAILRALVADDGEIVVAVGDQAGGKTFEILSGGVIFIVSIAEEIGDLTAFKAIFCNPGTAQIQCGLHIGLGHHVEGGERVPAIVQALLGMARTIGMSCDAVAAIWRPANVVSGFDHFEQSVAEYLGGGAFPVLALVNFKSRPEGVISTAGLSTLCGQELHAECGGMDESDMMRRIVRVVHDMATNGPVMDRISLDGLEPGERVKLEPAIQAAVLNMTICSISDA